MIWLWHTFAGIVALSLFISYKVGHKYTAVGGLLFAWVLILAVVQFQEPWFSIDPRIKLTAAQSFANTLGVAAVLYMLTDSHVRIALDSFKWIAAANCVPTLFIGYGMFGASSQDATFTALVLTTVALAPAVPSSDLWIKRGLIALYVITLLFTQSTTVLVVLITSFGSYLIMTRQFRFLLPLMTAVAAGGIVANRTLGELLRTQDRVGPWKQFMTWWLEHAPYYRGMGTGSFQYIGPYIQGLNDGRTKDMMLYMHNDYLQVLFEQGFVGLTLMLALAGVCLWRTRHAPWLFAMIIGVLASFVSQSPLRWFATQMLVGLIIRKALTVRLSKMKFKRKNHHEQQTRISTPVL